MKQTRQQRRPVSIERTLLDHYSKMSVMELIDEGQRFARQPAVEADDELSAFLALLIGRVAVQADVIERLTLLNPSCAIAPLTRRSR